jgi:hypothetical protein
VKQVNLIELKALLDKIDQTGKGSRWLDSAHIYWANMHNLPSGLGPSWPAP